MTIWRVGMLAVCVDAGPMKTLGGLPEVSNPEHIANLRQGGIYRVTHICRGRTDSTYVGIGDINKRAGGWEARFRPLVSEDDDNALVERIKRCKPARQPVEA